MKLARIIKEELVPLSSRENLILLIIISSIFQFALFFTPLLANEAVNEAKAASVSDNLIVISSPIIRDSAPDKDLAGLIDESEPEITNSTVTDKIEEEIIEKEKKPVVPENKIIRTSTHVITAYNSETAQTDDSPCITANGFNVCEHGVEDTIAANFLKFGTKVQIPELFGERVFIVRDRMNKKHPNRVDIWMVNRKDAVKFGVKTAKIVVIK